MNFEIKSFKKFKYIEEGVGEPLILLHGLMGSLSNYTETILAFKKKYRVIVPLLPLYDLDIFHTSVIGLKKYLKQFTDALNLSDMHLLGNSLGGHIALLYVLDNDNDKVKSLILTGSSGLFENGLGDTYPKRNNYEWVKRKAQTTFYDATIATPELIDDVFEIVNNRIKVIKIIYLARSAMKNYLGDKLHEIKIPTLLIWGNNDIVTPPFVAQEFHKLIAHSELFLIDKCGHAPMMETPQEFNAIVETFLQKLPQSN